MTHDILDMFEDEDTTDCVSPCSVPREKGPHACRVGGGAGYFIDDHGHSWLCRNHLPAGFLPASREPF